MRRCGWILLLASVLANPVLAQETRGNISGTVRDAQEASSTVPASEAQLRGDFSDLLRLPNPAQYQIYDPLTVRRDPANPNRFIRDPFPNNIIPANRIVNPLYHLYRDMVPKPNQNLIENGATPTGNYYRGGEPDKPVSSLYAGRVDYNMSARNRFFFRTDPVLYQRMAANGFFTATTTQRHRLLRPFSHINNLTYDNLPLREVKVHSLQVNVNRRFADGFTANAALSFNSSRTTSRGSRRIRRRRRPASRHAPSRSRSTACAGRD